MNLKSPIYLCGKEVIVNKLRVLVLDIETAPMLAYVWHRKEQRISIDQIKRDWFILAWSAKWFGASASSIVYEDQRHSSNVEDDRLILKKIWMLLDEADVVITQNGKNFDSRKLNARFILNGFHPPSPYRHFDTYQLASRVGDFTSCSLEYLTEKLCTKYTKLSHKKYPGLKLWKECLVGNVDAWNEMRRYNIHDVLSTEELATKIRAWAPRNFPDIFPVIDPSQECGSCGTKGKMDNRGLTKARIKNYRRYRCRECGKYQQGFKPIEEAA